MSRLTFVYTSTLFKELPWRKRTSAILAGQVTVYKQRENLTLVSTDDVTLLGNERSSSKQPSSDFTLQLLLIEYFFSFHVSSVPCL